MPKSNNRETVTLGQPTLAEIKAKLDKQVDKTVRTQSEIAKLAARPGIGEDRSRFAKLFESELAAAMEAAAAKDAERAAGLYPSRVDPGDVVGLDEVTPDSETAVDGDSKGTDPNAG